MQPSLSLSVISTATFLAPCFEPLQTHTVSLCWIDDVSNAGNVQWLLASLTWCLEHLLLEH